jgi:hypothetical protein
MFGDDCGHQHQHFAAGAANDYYLKTKYMYPINEELLQYIFELKLYSSLHLHTTAGEALRIHKTGFRNRNSGPDFLQGLIQIDEVQLAGNIELHLRSSEWNRHGHSSDKAYDNVILHVVYEHDEEIYVHGKALPTLELKHIIFANVFTNYENLLISKSAFPCEKSISQVPAIIVNAAIDAALSDRFHRKRNLLESVIEACNADHEEGFYRLLASSFGFGVNKHAFAKLAELLPLHLLKKHAHSLFQLEAMLFGVAGFLNEEKDEYQKRLKLEYDFLRKKYELANEMVLHEWHFSKMHPVNFPTIRIAQFASLMHENAHIYASIKLENKLPELMHMFRVEPSEYWLLHYTFGQASSKKKKQLGVTSAQILIINAVCVMLYSLGEEEERLRERAHRFLQEIPAESNHITKQYQKAGIALNDSYTSQAILELHEQLCNKKLCMNCAIGSYLLKS